MSTPLATMTHRAVPLPQRLRWGVVLLAAIPLATTLASLLWLPGPATTPATPAASSVAAPEAVATPAMPAPPTLSPAMHAEYRQAVRLFRSGRFAAAYGRFAQLADAGHAPSARIALVMVEQGPRLFGSDWDAWPQQLQEWADLARLPAPVTVAGFRDGMTGSQPPVRP